MSTCIRGREVIVAIRKPKHETRHYTVICPSRWDKDDFLDYVRGEHLGETVRIVDWKPESKEDSWEPRIWIANPAGFTNYVRATLPALETS